MKYKKYKRNFLKRNKWRKDFSLNDSLVRSVKILIYFCKTNYIVWSFSPHDCTCTIRKVGKVLHIQNLRTKKSNVFWLVWFTYQFLKRYCWKKWSDIVKSVTEVSHDANLTDNSTLKSFDIGNYEGMSL